MEEIRKTHRKEIFEDASISTLTAFLDLNLYTKFVLAVAAFVSRKKDTSQQHFDKTGAPVDDPLALYSGIELIPTSGLFWHEKRKSLKRQNILNSLHKTV